MQAAAYNIKLSQIILLLGLLVSTVLSPHFLFSHNQGGISNYGTNWLTIIPFGIGLGGCAYFLLKAAAHIRATQPRHDIIIWLRLLAVGYFLTLVSACLYKLGPLYKSMHFYVAGIFVAFTTVMAVWLIVHADRNAQALFWLAIFLSGVVIMVATINKLVTLLFTGELLAIVGFAGVLLSCSHSYLNDQYKA